MMARSALQLAYYGDDFTGSTDALEFLSRAGLRCELFLRPPEASLLERRQNLDALGVAGFTRSLAPEVMEAELRPVFSALRALGPRHVHYKVCSTFDSSPSVGNIGRALEVGMSVFQQSWAPLLVAAPSLGRFCCFGNLFARYGIGSAGEIHRLDRHPAMSRHPVTPADESDLRRHLARQTDRRQALFDLLQLAKPESERLATFQAMLASGAEIVHFDGFDAEDLQRVGGLLEPLGSSQAPLFSAGSSGVEMALGSVWREQGLFTARTQWPGAGEASPLLVLSGSCSPVTAGQIDWALANGFVGVDLEVAALARGEPPTAALQSIQTALETGRSVVAFTSRGAGAVSGTAPSLSLTPQQSARVGAGLGSLARALLSQGSLRRLVFAGGDSSSHAAQALGIESLSFLAPLAPGAPLCRVHAPGSSLDGCELCFKGGQVGAPDFFGAARKGVL